MEQQLILDRYRPLAELGSGGHAAVTLAYDTRIGRRVAVKRLPLPRDPLGRPRRVGLAEARTAALLAHPAIVTVYDWQTDADEAFLVMEWVEGVSLADLLERLGRLDIDEAAAVLGPVADALAFAHENGVLHLDVKPENVLVTRGGTVKVADFGVASLTSLGGTATADEGTLGFMAPEQLRGEPLDARADEWALASLAYEALTGANPFAADTPALALVRAQADVPVPSTLLRDIPEAVDDPLLVALAPCAADRFPDVATFAAELLDALGDPDAGRDSLAAVVVELTGEEPAEEEEGYGRLGVWDRLAPFAPWATRAGAAFVSAWLAYVGLLPFRVGPVPALAAAALAALAAAFAPALGLALGLGLLALGTLATDPVGGLVVLVFGVALWFAAGRRSRGDVPLSLAAPAFGVVRAAPAVPLLLGFTFEPLPAAVAAGFAALSVQAASALSGSGPPLLAVDAAALADPWRAFGVAGRFAAFASPGPYLAALAWAAAAAALSLLCRRGTRVSAGIGLALATVVLLAGYAAWSATGNGLVWPSVRLLQQLAASLILMAVVVALGAPVRGRLDDDVTADEPG